MEHQIKGKVWVFGDQINTDLMYPHVCYSQPEERRPYYTMWANRPGWSEMVGQGDIIIAGRNFGVGSSRPAAANLKGLGLSCAIAESVNGLFLRNAVNFGFPAISCPGISGFAREGEYITVDLDSGEVRKENGESLKFQPLPGFLMEIIDAGGIIEVLKKKGYLETEPL